MNNNEIVSVLTQAKVDYYNGNTSLTDAEFDNFEKILKYKDPGNPYFIGIGSPVRQEDKVKLPVTMGSLDQVQEGEIEKWLERHNLKDETFVISEKMDGNSGLLVFVDGELQIAFTRGDGEFGKDITRHYRRMVVSTKKVYDWENLPNPLFVVGEFEMQEKTFEKANQEEMNGKYKNARNFVAGQLNREVAENSFYEHCDFIAFGIRNIYANKFDNLRALQENLFDVPRHKLLSGEAITSSILMEIFDMFKESGDYEIDGVVVDINNVSVSSKMDSARKETSSSKNPASSKKFKLSSKNELKERSVVVEKVHWNISKNGVYKPRVEFKEIELSGVSIKFATGHNAEYIFKNGIGPGAVINVIRSGDVIPYITEVKLSVKPQLPDQNDNPWEWNENGVEIISSSSEISSGQKMKQIEYFFQSIGVKGFGLPSVEKLYFNGGYQTIEDIIGLQPDRWAHFIGKNGIKIQKSIKEKLNPVKHWVLAGSHPAFKTGIGKRVLKKVFDFHGGLHNLSIEQLCKVPGVSEITANKIKEAEEHYLDFLSKMSDVITYEIPNKKEDFTKGYWVFTGIRDKELEAKLTDSGIEVGSSLSKATFIVAKDPDGNSNKLKKARERGIPIMSIEDARNKIVDN